MRIEHQAALARIEEMRRYADATRRPRLVPVTTGVLPDPAIRDRVATALRTLADHATPSNVRGSMSGDVPDVRSAARADDGRQPITKD